MSSLSQAEYPVPQYGAITAMLLTLELDGPLDGAVGDVGHADLGGVVDAADQRRAGHRLTAQLNFHLVVSHRLTGYSERYRGHISATNRERSYPGNREWSYPGNRQQ